jgi:hypothetical protein
MATPFDNSDDSFINIDDFDLDNKGADIREPDDDNADLTLPLSATPLETIKEEEDNGPKLGPKPKKTRRGTVTLTIGQRIQGLYQLDRGDPFFKVIKDTRVSKASLYRIREKAISLRWVPSTIIKPHYVNDLPRLGRPRVSTYITTSILIVLTRNSTTCGYSCRRIAQEVSANLPRRQFI